MDERVSKDRASKHNDLRGECRRRVRSAPVCRTQHTIVTPGGVVQPMIAVAAWLRNVAGHVLVIRRARGRPAAGYWTPVTGTPRANESLADALVREVFEEVGLRVSVGDEVARHRLVGVDGELVWLCASLTQPEDALQACPDEVAEARWVTAQALMTLTPMFEVTRTTFLQLLHAQDVVE